MSGQVSDDTWCVVFWLESGLLCNLFRSCSSKEEAEQRVREARIRSMAINRVIKYSAMLYREFISRRQWQSRTSIDAINAVTIEC